MAAAAAPAARRERRAERAGPGHSRAGRRRTLTVAPAPRRVSGPSRRAAPQRPRPRPTRRAGAERGLVLAAAAGLAKLPLLWPSRLPLSHSRVAQKVGPTVLARIWIGLVAFAQIFVQSDFSGLSLGATIATRYGLLRLALIAAAPGTCRSTTPAGTAPAASPTPNAYAPLTICESAETTCQATT